MTRRPRAFALFSLFVYLFGCSVAWGQTAGVEPSLILLREQSGSLAEEVLRGVELREGDQVALRVTGATTVLFVENAFIEALQRRQCKAVLDGEKVRGNASLDILILNQGVRFSLVSAAGFERSIQTTIEARYRAQSTEASISLGTFQRSLKDTVKEREELTMFSSQAENVEEISAFQRLFTPVILVAGAFMVVYLFFTIRN